jgi:hypothetical protein
MAHAYAANVLLNGTAQIVKIGPLVSSLNGRDPATGLNLTNLKTGLKISKNNAALASVAQASAVTEDALGYYNVDFDAADTTIAVAEENVLIVSVQMAGILPYREKFRVEAAVL